MQRHARKRLTPEQAFAKVLRAVRTERGLSQEKLALESGYHRTYVGMLERGLMNPTLHTILSLASVLEIPAGELVARTAAIVGPGWRREAPERNWRKSKQLAAAIGPTWCHIGVQSLPPFDV
jgi:transcriptional regulator with XRE-family HTH domain